jgi:hypothetical protein
VDGRSFLNDHDIAARFDRQPTDEQVLQSPGAHEC